MVATITLTPNTGAVGMQKVRVTGAGYTAGATIATFTFGGATPPINTVIGTVVPTGGSWSGTFTVPYSSAAVHAVVAADAHPETASANFTTKTSILKDTSGPAHGTANAAATVTALFSTTSHPDLLVAVVAWKDTGLSSVSLSDNSGVTTAWTPRGQPFVSGAYQIQEFYSWASAAIAAKTLTATFSAATSGHSTVTVCGLTDAAYPTSYDSNVGLPSAYTDSGTLASFITRISTHYAPTLLFGAMMLIPSAAITAGTGFTQVDAVNATDFYLETELVIVTNPQVDHTVTWSAASAAYTVLGFTDAILQANATNAPWATQDIGAKVQGITIKSGVTTYATSTEQGVAKWEMPSTTASIAYQTVTNDRSGGLTGTTTAGTTGLILHDTNLSLTANEYAGQTLTYTSGDAYGQSRTITANGGQTITVGVAFSPAPADNGDSFVVTPMVEETHTSDVESVIGVGGETAKWETSQTSVASG